MNVDRATAKGVRRFKPYPAYKDSGVEWLGDIPVHWACLALAHVTLSRCDGPFGSGLKSEHYSATGVRVVRLQNIGSAEFLDSDEAYVEEAYARHLGDHSVRTGDLLIAGLGDEGHPVGRSCAAPDSIEPAMVKADCFRFRLDCSRLLARFAAYQLSTTASAAAGSLATGSTRSRVNLTTMASRKLAMPPLDEQRTIAAFLDRETPKVDALVAKKERLIELLYEKRAAIITQAVTKGLDSNVPMKDSGVEWLGAIPTHWRCERIKWAARLESGHTPDKKVESYWLGGDVPWVSLADTAQLREVDYIADTAVRTTADGIAHSSAHVLPAGTVVFSRDATIGLCAITRAGLAVSQHFIGWGVY